MRGGEGGRKKREKEITVREDGGAACVPNTTPPTMDTLIDATIFALEN